MIPTSHIVSFILDSLGYPYLAEHAKTADYKLLEGYIGFIKLKTKADTKLQEYIDYFL